METIGMYPTFYVPYVGTAWVMGTIGVIHVLASHTSVGAAFLFAVLETKAYREAQPQLMDFIKRFGVFLLVFSYIIGSITGPGIWYAITVASPRGVSGLIHNFVWVWAAEWVFFTVEVIGVYALVYLIGKIDAKSHLKLTWSFALASWATMLLIVGILSFMMWPGHESWFQTGSTNAAFYNLNFFAHLGVRTGSMLVMAAVVGLIVAAGIRDADLKRDVIRLMTPIGLLGGFFATMMFIYYLQTVPENARIMLKWHLLPSYAAGMILVAVATTAYLILVWLRPRYVRTWIAVPAFLFIALVGVWPEERMRESMRKPFVAGQYIYGNQVIARDVPGKGITAEVDALAEKGYLELHPFIPARLRTITDENKLEVGELLTKIACANCHALEPGAPLRSIPDKLLRSPDKDLIAAFLAGPLRHGAVAYMPRIDLPDREIDAIATFLAQVDRNASPPAEGARRISAETSLRAGSN
ncbi:MAG TPA: cytochrome c [Bradyrhizobium sp.]|nr:cytochrome c [Bradyrhizobium sp.]